MLGTNAAAAAFYSRDLGLEPSGVASIFGWAAFGGIASFPVSRAIDRVGRNRTAFASALGLAISAGVVALASSFVAFVSAQVAATCAAGTLLASSTVTVSEELGAESRAGGQARAGVAFQLGIGAAMIVIAAAATLGISWRLAWAGVGMAGLVIAALAHSLPETRVFGLAARSGLLTRARARELLAPAQRPRTLATAANSLLLNLSSIATSSWFIFYPETALGVTPVLATTIVIGGGAIGLAGFPLGALLCRRIGRRATYALAATASLTFHVLYYHVPRDLPISRALAMAALIAGGSVCFGAGVVALRTLSTELFPTRVRGTQQGLATASGALGGLVAQVATAALVPRMGGLVPAITLLGLAGIPGIILLYVAVPETAGSELND